MQPEPIERRIVWALSLAPMTVPDLTRMLSSSYEATRNRVKMLEDAGVIAKAGMQRGSSKWRPRIVWKLVDTDVGEMA